MPKQRKNYLGKNSKETREYLISLGIARIEILAIEATGRNLRGIRTIPEIPAIHARAHQLYSGLNLNAKQRKKIGKELEAIAKEYSQRIENDDLSLQELESIIAGSLVRDYYPKYI